MKVVVVESPAKAKTIEKYLGSGFKVLASYGHVRDLPSKDGSVDVDNDFAMHYRTAPDSEKTIKAIAKEVANADTLYLATDLDREGEAISWHVLEELKARVKGFDKVDVKRIEFSEITKNAIQHAINNPRVLAQNLVDAQQARRALDYLVGFNLSPVLWRKVRTGLSAGRVQSVALRLICERENEIEAFKAEEYWTIEGTFTTAQHAELKAKLTHYNGDKLDKFSINTEALATAAQQTLSQQQYAVHTLEQKEVKRNPYPPFITSTLQMDASRQLGFSARRTMSTAQRLYEAGYITYMRTDSVNLSQEAINGARIAIEGQFGKNYVPAKPNFYKSKTQNAQEAHEAIRPTDFTQTPEMLANKLEGDQLKLYRLIWQRGISCQMVPARMNRTTLEVADSKAQHIFRATGSVMVFDGFLKAYDQGKDEDSGADSDNQLLPDVTKGEAVAVRQIMPEQHFTEPPPRFSEASLVKALEENGIGRPSTYAAIISTIQDRGYVRLEKRRFFPEDVGRVVNKFLTEHFPRYVDLGFTAEMENELDEISRGQKEWKPMLRQFWSPFKGLVDEKMESVRKSDVTSEATGEKCPECGQGELVHRLGRYGKFKGCNRYPDCKYIEKKAADGAERENTDKPTGVTCPVCTKNEIMEKRSRRGKIFYGCSGYPKCKNAYWDRPELVPCPSCGNPVTTVKELKSGAVRKCPACDWQDPPAAKKAAPKKASAKKEAPKKTATKRAVKKAS